MNYNPVRMSKPKPLSDVLSLYVSTKVSLSPGYIEQLTVVVNLFERHLGRSAISSDLTGENVRGWMRWLLALPRSARTVNGRAATLCSLWRFAHAKKLCRKAPSEIPRLREPACIPCSYTDEQFAAMVGACADLKHHGPIMRGLLLVLWDTGCRLGAVLATKRSSFDLPTRTVRIMEPKTLKEQVYQLSETTAQALAILTPENGTLLGWRCTPTALRNLLVKIQEKVGIPRDRWHKFHCVRKTKYSAVYARFGLKVASDHLGHTSDLSRNYLDTRRLVDGSITSHLPPPIAG